MEITLGLGWLKERPDIRDFTRATDHLTEAQKQDGDTLTVKAMIAKAGIKDSTKMKIPEYIDLSAWCSPIEQQGALGSCTAQAGVGMVEYFERRAFGNYMDASRLFLYKVTRNLLGWTGDTGAYLRSTMGAITIFGLPPEKVWPYDISRYDIEPSAFLYSYAQNFQGLNYFRLDPPGATREEILNGLKQQLAAGIPAMFGFTCYTSLSHSSTSISGCIPFPSAAEKVLGGHAVMAVGYDNSKIIINPLTNEKTTGAVKIRNSWGEEWGEQGYGWIPYQYIQAGIAEDFWCLIKAEYLETGEFGL